MIIYQIVVIFFVRVSYWQSLDKLAQERLVHVDLPFSVHITISILIFTFQFQTRVLISLHLYTMRFIVPFLQSSFLMSILGELPLSKGQITVKGKIGYASQQAWIYNGTLRQNIIFGSDYEEGRYNDVIKACALLKV